MAFFAFFDDFGGFDSDFTCDFACEEPVEDLSVFAFFVFGTRPG
jgi:hypothetical protein